jgi:hypothetical protein
VRETRVTGRTVKFTIKYKQICPEIGYLSSLKPGVSVPPGVREAS